MKLVIAGAGRSGLSLAIHMQEIGHSVTILEREHSISRRAVEAHGIVALTGDASDAATLREAEPQRADAVIAMLNRDADNLAVAMLARSLGARRVLVRMRDPDYRPVYVAAGVQKILSETEILVGGLATAIEFESVRHSMVLGSGEAIAVELVVPAEGWVVGRAVSAIAAAPAFPASCVVAGIALEGRVQAPRGATVIEAGARLLVVAARDDLARTVAFFLASVAPY